MRIGEQSLDPMVDYFQELFKRNNLVDIIPTKLSPTWKNKRVGNEGVGKRLDHFLYGRVLCGKMFQIHIVNHS